MKKNAVVTVESKVTGAEDEQLVKTACPGSFYEKNGCMYIIYDEEVKVGEEESIPAKMTIKYYENGVAELMRKGYPGMTMRLEPGEPGCFLYVTPYGNMPLTVETSFLECEKTENFVVIKAAYDLFSKGEVLSSARITISVEIKDV